MSMIEVSEQEKIRRLGRENAKLALKISRQRTRIRQLSGAVTHTQFVVSEKAEAVHRENINLREQNTKLATENRALRLYIAEGKVRPEGLAGFIRQVLRGER